jgi:hypothetical protein
MGQQVDQTMLQIEPQKVTSLALITVPLEFPLYHVCSVFVLHKGVLSQSLFCCSPCCNCFLILLSSGMMSFYFALWQLPFVFRHIVVKGSCRDIPSSSPSAMLVLTSASSNNYLVPCINSALFCVSFCSLTTSLLMCNFF